MHQALEGQAEQAVLGMRSETPGPGACRAQLLI